MTVNYKNHNAREYVLPPKGSSRKMAVHRLLYLHPQVWIKDADGSIRGVCVCGEKVTVR